MSESESELGVPQRAAPGQHSMRGLCGGFMVLGQDQDWDKDEGKDQEQAKG